MSLAVRGLGLGLLVTRGLGSHTETPYLSGDITLRVDRFLTAALAVDVAHWGNLSFDRETDSVLPAARSVEWTLRVCRDRSEDLKIGK